MHHQLRLAERQDMLKGPDLSEVQIHASEVLMLLEDVENYRQTNDARNTNLKLALLARSEFAPEKLFPENFNQEDTNQNGDSDDVEYDYSNVEWVSPKDVDADQRDKLMSMIYAGARRMDFSQVETGSGEWV